MISFHNRKDVKEYLKQFDNHEVYFFMKEKYDELTNFGEKDTGEEGDKIQEQIVKLASEKFNMNTEKVNSILKEFEVKAFKFMFKR